MLRRDLLKAIGGAALLPACANAQQRNVPHIGVLWRAGAPRRRLYISLRCSRVSPVSVTLMGRRFRWTIGSQMSNLSGSPVLPLNS
jgi:hypothetical protein